uniref:F-box/kelch-repeat protein At1g51550 n=1 Tax=Anthurium amnicola TaxID=1678845 RepID=A0A1D1XH03_9ARAE
MKSTTGTETERLPHYPTFKSKRKALLPMAESSRSSQTAATSSPSVSSFSSSRDSSMTQMNDDQIFSILQLLPVESVLSFCMTCRKFRSLASSDPLWEAICRREWGEGPVDSLLASLSPERRGVSWKRLYQQVVQLNSLSCRTLSSKDGIFPKPRASHTLNFVSDCLVLYGGGCDGAI